MILGEKDGGIAVVQGSQRMAFAMMHYDRNVFTYVSEGESTAGAAGISYTLGAGGRSTEVFVDNLDVRGEGTFTHEHPITVQ